MSDFSLVFSRRLFSGGVFLFRGDITTRRAHPGMGLWCCRWRENRRRKTFAVVIRQKSKSRHRDLSQEGTLKMQLKIRHGTVALRKNDLKMSDGLNQGINVRTFGRRLFAAESRPQRGQILKQPATQPIHRFQREGQPHLFSGRLERKPRQHFDQPLPHQRSRQSVTRQNIRQHDGKCFSATAAPSTVGTKDSLAAHTLAAGLRRIIAP